MSEFRPVDSLSLDSRLFFLLFCMSYNFHLIPDADFRFLAVVYSPSLIWLFCDPMDYSLLRCSVPGISQARMLERFAIS